MEKGIFKFAESIETLVCHFGVHGVECCENISHGEYRALRTVLHKDVCTMQDIAKSVVVTKSGATRIIQRLEEKGLVRRERDGKDGRVCCVTLTENGNSFLLRNNSDLIQKLQAVLETMEPTLKEILILSIGAFSQALYEWATKEEELVSDYASLRHDYS